MSSPVNLATRNSVTTRIAAGSAAARPGPGTRESPRGFPNNLVTSPHGRAPDHSQLVHGEPTAPPEPLETPRPDRLVGFAGPVLRDVFGTAHSGPIGQHVAFIFFLCPLIHEEKKNSPFDMCYPSPSPTPAFSGTRGPFTSCIW